MSLQGAIEWVQDQALSISGVGYAPDNLSDSSPTTVWVLAYARDGEIGISSANWGRDYDNISVRIYTARVDLNESMQRLEGYPHNLARKLQADITLGGNVATFESLTYRWFSDEFGGVPVIGYELMINRVKSLTTF